MRKKTSFDKATGAGSGQMRISGTNGSLFEIADLSVDAGIRSRESAYPQQRGRGRRKAFQRRIQGGGDRLGIKPESPGSDEGQSRRGFRLRENAKTGRIDQSESRRQSVGDRIDRRDVAFMSPDHVQAGKMGAAASHLAEKR